MLTMTKHVVALMAIFTSCQAYEYCTGGRYCSTGYCCGGGYYCCTHVYGSWWFWMIIIGIIAGICSGVGYWYRRRNANLIAAAATSAVITSAAAPVQQAPPAYVNAHSPPAAKQPTPIGV